MEKPAHQLKPGDRILSNSEVFTVEAIRSHTDNDSGRGIIVFLDRPRPNGKNYFWHSRSFMVEVV